MTAVASESVARHGSDALAPASGRTLSLLSIDQRGLIPEAATPVDHWHGGVEPEGVYQSILSLGQLGLADDLPGLLAVLISHMDGASLIYFCEPTRRVGRRPMLPNDVTTTIWAHGLTVIECGREHIRRHWRGRESCWGRARLTPPGSAR